MANNKIQELKEKALEQLQNVQSAKELQDLKVLYLGKKGPIQELMSSMKDLSKEERPAFGQAVNEVKSYLEGKMEEAKAELEEKELALRLENEKIDISLPGFKLKQGNLHPLVLMQRELEDIFMGMGYSVEEGPEVELDLYNFERANIPQDHPARDMQDTFYINAERLLRTHTTAIQTRQLEAAKGQLPIKMICPGKVYRRDDDDATHSHQFTQMEGLVVAEHVTLADLKGTLEFMAKKVLGEQSKVRFRPSFFPFTEPSVEVDISCHMCGGKGCNVCKGTGWIEVLGAGMVHPDVLEMAGIDSTKASGFAFGVGIERIAMLKYGVDDIRHFYNDDVRFLGQFNRFEQEELIMKLSYNWIKELVDLEGISPTELADKLTNAGFEVEGIEKRASGTNLVIGEIMECEDHPDSDHLHCCKVNVGDEVLNIVCGAPNARKGLKVIVAKVGAELPEITIKKGNIRGQESNGMLCALRELGVDPKTLTDYQNAGIEELPEDAVVGNTKVLEYLGLDDVILDVGLTPNRADFMSYFAAAKEVSAVVKRPVKLPTSKKPASEDKATLKVGTTTDKCSYYLGKYIHHVTIKESPKWMIDRLHACGIKAINNVVDISNYVMLETGQPLHFYDASKNAAKELIAESDKSFDYEALDGVTYHIEPSDIVIMSGNECDGIAGIMGGEDSKIEDSTTEILIEAAAFSQVAIRNSSRRLNLNTEAATRFIKGIEPLGPDKAVERAVSLLMEYADASGIEETVSAGSANYTPKKLDVTLSFINGRLGTKYTMDDVTKELAALDFNPVVEGDTIHLNIPSYRIDISIPEDITEEVIRLIGYDSLESTLPEMPMTLGALTKEQRTRRTLEATLCGFGLQQVLSYTLVSQDMIDDGVMPLADSIALAFPISEDKKIVRSSLLPSMLNVVNYNMSRNQNDVNIFEMSNVYGGDVVEERLGIVLQGALQELPWTKIAIPSNFYTLKGIVEDVFEKLGFSSARVYFKENTVDTVHFHKGKSAAVYLGKELVGIIGAIHPTLAKKYGIKEVYMAELKLNVLNDAKAGKVKYTALPKYPGSRRDLALVVDRSMAVSAIEDVIRKAGKALVKGVEVFDIYEGEHVADDKKSVALSILYQDENKTLTDNDINGEQEKIMNALESELKVELRK